MHLFDPHFPNLPLVTDEEYATWPNEKKHKRHTIEVAEAARIFAALQADGVDIFIAAERTPMARMNRAGSRQEELRQLYQEEPPPTRK